jgi:hypothetical protein
LSKRCLCFALAFALVSGSVPPTQFGYKRLSPRGVCVLPSVPPFHYNTQTTYTAHTLRSAPYPHHHRRRPRAGLFPTPPPPPPPRLSSSSSSSYTVTAYAWGISACFVSSSGPAGLAAPGTRIGRGDGALGAGRCCFFWGGVWEVYTHGQMDTFSRRGAGGRRRG